MDAAVGTLTAPQSVVGGGRVGITVREEPIPGACVRVVACVVLTPWPHWQMHVQVTDPSGGAGLAVRQCAELPATVLANCRDSPQWPVVYMVETRVDTSCAMPCSGVKGLV